MEDFDLFVALQDSEVCAALFASSNISVGFPWGWGSCYRDCWPSGSSALKPQWTAWVVARKRKEWRAPSTRACGCMRERAGPFACGRLRAWAFTDVRTCVSGRVGECACANTRVCVRERPPGAAPPSERATPPRRAPPDPRAKPVHV
eukprot:6203635-Pleurochrysis_carterae.AAC.2